MVVGTTGIARSEMCSRTPSLSSSGSASIFQRVGLRTKGWKMRKLNVRVGKGGFS